jgi:hypothetical protein
VTYLNGESIFETLDPRSKCTRIAAILHPVISSSAGKDHSLSSVVGTLMSRASNSAVVATQTLDSSSRTSSKHALLLVK